MVLFFNYIILYHEMLRKTQPRKKDQQEPLQDAAAPRPAGLTGLPNRQWKFKKIIPPAARSAMQGPSGVAQALMAQEDGPKNGQNDMRRSPTCVIKVSKAIGLEQKPTDTAPPPHSGKSTGYSHSSGDWGQFADISTKENSPPKTVHASTSATTDALAGRNTQTSAMPIPFIDSLMRLGRNDAYTSEESNTPAVGSQTSHQEPEGVFSISL